MHFVPPLSSILPSGNETMVPFAKLLSLSSKPTAVFCCDASLPGCSCQRALEGSGRHGRGRLCLLSAPVHAAAAAGQPSAAAATASASSGDPRASLGAPTGTPLKFSDVSNSQAMSFPQSLGPVLRGPPRSVWVPISRQLPFVPAPGVGLLPAVILITSVFPKPCPSNPQYGST